MESFKIHINFFTTAYKGQNGLLDSPPHIFNTNNISNINSPYHKLQ